VRYTFTAVYVHGEEGCIVGYVEELPGVLTQGRTIKEAQQQMPRAIELILEANRKFTAEPFRDARVARREPILISESPLRRRGRGEA
jgi:predicted RNase H-like HicB family nuclease